MGDVQEEHNSYDFLSWEIDTTGRRLIDEMCHLAVYAPCCSFKQYIMPYRDIDYNSRKRHLLKTVNIGVYRVLRETVGGKILKTKSEVSALTDFLVWLEQRKLLGSKDIVLMYYETVTPAPFILIESLKKYELLPRFKETVRGFANCYNFIKSKCEKSMQTYSIKTLAKMLLNKEYEKPHDAFERARTVFEIVAHLSVGESQDGEEDFSAALENHVSSIEQVETGIAEMKQNLNKQNELKPIFGPIIRYDKKRRHAINLRRHLTNADIGYEALKVIWSSNEDVSTYLKNNLKNEISDQDFSDLVGIISKHFGGNTSNIGAEVNSQTDKSKANSAASIGKTNIEKNVSPSKSSYKKNYKNKGNKNIPQNIDSSKLLTVTSNVESKNETSTTFDKENDDSEKAPALSEVESDVRKPTSVEENVNP